MSGYNISTPAVLVPHRIASLLARRLDLRAFRITVRGRDAELDAVLLALHEADLRWRTAICSAAGGTTFAVPAERAAVLTLSTRQAASLLRTTTRGVRMAIQRDRLPARKVAGAWQIDPADLHSYDLTRQPKVGP